MPGYKPTSQSEYNLIYGGMKASGYGIPLAAIGTTYSNANNSLGTWVNPPPFVAADPIRKAATRGGDLDLGNTLDTAYNAVTKGLNTPLFTPGSWGANLIDDAGASLGLGGSTFSGSAGSATIGNGAKLTTGSTGGIASGFTPGAALAGIGGAFAADLLGLSGEYSSVTGTLGGVAGTAVGTSMGTILGFAGGPVGAAIGAFLGSALGGVFGGKKPNPASVVGSNYGVTSAGTFADGGMVNSKHQDTKFAEAMRSTVDKFNTSLHQQTGEDLSKTIKTLYAGYDVNNGPGFITFNSYFKKDHEHHNPATSFYFDPNNQESMVTALRNYGSKVLESTGKAYSPEDVARIVNTALTSLKQPEQSSSEQSIAGATNSDTLINRNTDDGRSFDKFLEEYKSRYNSTEVE